MDSIHLAQNDNNTEAEPKQPGFISRQLNSPVETVGKAIVVAAAGFALYDVSADIAKASKAGILTLMGREVVYDNQALLGCRGARDAREAEVLKRQREEREQLAREYREELKAQAEEKKAQRQRERDRKQQDRKAS